MVSRKKVQLAVAYIQEKTTVAHPGTIGLVLGSGLGGVVKNFALEDCIDYAKIDGFPNSDVAGHAGKLLIGELAGRKLMVMSGRVHLYEGHDAATACLPVRMLRELGVETLILTNAAGSLNHAFLAGSLMLVDDHINFTAQSPFTGPNEENWGPRFPDCSQIYSPRLRDLAAKAARQLEYDLNRGIYLQVAGPQYETPAETRAFRLLGADAIGMSTAIEALAGAHMGMEVMAISCLTNQNLTQDMNPTKHEQVLDVAEQASHTLARLLETMLPQI